VGKRSTLKGFICGKRDTTGMIISAKKVTDGRANPMENMI